MRPGAGWVLKILVLAFVNYVTGRLGLVLAVPPGFATAVFPPSGIALGALLVFGPRLWPGVFLGSLVFNIHISISGNPDATVAGSALPSALIALGSSLQAVCGALVVRRVLPEPIVLDEGRDIARFLLLGGPLSCLVGATVGILTLFGFGILSLDKVLYNWLTWWVGDTIGVLIFAPLVLIAFGQPREVWRPRALTLAVPLAVFFALSTLVFLLASVQEQRALHLGFRGRCDVLLTSIENEIRRGTGGLGYLAGAIRTYGQTSRSDFRGIVRDVLRRNPAIRAIEWVPRVPHEERERFEEEVRRSAGREGDPDLRRALETFALKRWSRAEGWVNYRDGTAPVYYPVTYVEPFDGNEAALGIDLGSNPDCRRAIDEALATGRAVATGSVRLAQEDEGQSGILLLHPVAAKEETGRAAPPAGFVLVVLRMGDLVEHALAFVDRTGIGIEITVDAPGAEGARPIFAAGVRAKGSEGFEARRTFHVSGRTWGITAFPEPGATDLGGGVSWAIQATSLIFTAGLGGVLLVLTGRTSRIERVIGERTLEIQRKNLELMQINQDLDRFAYVASHDLKQPLRGIEQLCEWIVQDAGPVLSGESGEHLAMMRKRVKRMGMLLDDLLTYSRAGRVRNTSRLVETGALVREVIEMLAPPKDVEIVVGPDMPTVFTDPTPLEHVFSNLIGNAIKHGRREGGRIEIRAEERGNNVRFTVSDNGDGIDPEFHGVIFNMFRTLRSRDEVEGSGMGLALVKRLVESEGGTIRVDSAKGRGASFTFTWPKQSWAPTRRPDRPV